MLLALYMLFYAEIVQNFFADFSALASVGEAFFTLSEALFGSVKFADETEVQESTFYGANANLLFYTFTSNILATFLLIAYLSSIYDMVQKNASYSNTKNQYYFLHSFSKMSFKGFYSFPPLLAAAAAPFLFFYRIPKLKAKIRTILLGIRYYSTVVTVWIGFHCFVLAFGYLPVIYIKNAILIVTGKVLVDGWRALHLMGWIFGGPFVILYYGVIDIILILKVSRKNLEV